MPCNGLSQSSQAQTSTEAQSTAEKHSSTVAGSSSQAQTSSQAQFSSAAQTSTQLSSSSVAQTTSETQTSTRAQSRRRQKRSRRQYAPTSSVQLTSTGAQSTSEVVTSSVIQTSTEAVSTLNTADTDERCPTEWQLWKHWSSMDSRDFMYQLMAFPNSARMELDPPPKLESGTAENLHWARRSPWHRAFTCRRHDCSRQKRIFRHFFSLHVAL